MTYPKTRKTRSRSRSRSRNMRKKHLVKSKSKRINRSRKSKKNHSRKYRGGDSAVSAEDIQAIIDAGNANRMTGSYFAKQSFLFNSSNTNNFLAESRPGPTFIASTSRDALILHHFLYRSKNNYIYLVDYKQGTGELTVYFLPERMINYIRTQDEVENRRITLANATTRRRELARRILDEEGREEEE